MAIGLAVANQWLNYLRKLATFLKYQFHEDIEVSWFIGWTTQSVNIAAYSKHLQPFEIRKLLQILDITKMMILQPAKKIF